MSAHIKNTRKQRQVRHERVRKTVGGTAQRPRLAVFKSLNHMYAQVIDDTKRHTLVEACTLDPEIKAKLEKMPKTGAARLVGEAVAQRAIQQGLKQVVFDRGGHQYHGRVKALAEGARKGGLLF